nr:hypothetical protein [uncultured bacterium]
MADSVLAPAAEGVDATASIPQSHFDALANAGLFGMIGRARIERAVSNSASKPPRRCSQRTVDTGWTCGTLRNDWHARRCST